MPCVGSPSGQTRTRRSSPSASTRRRPTRQARSSPRRAARARRGAAWARSAGTPEERKATRFIAGEMRDAGLEAVVEEPVPVDAWRLRDAYVEAGGERYECASFGGVPETGKRGVRGELVRAGRGGRRELDRL